MGTGLARRRARRGWTTVPTGDSDLALDVPDDSTVAADEARLRNVFENLYRNAIGHNAAPVTVTVGLLDAASAGGDGAAGFYVEDDGIGIDTSHRETVFDDGYTTDAAGTGLGLSIVADIVEAHGWTVSATTGARGGARFEIRTSERAGR
ncbi:MAG: sensor histidine kinase [Halarchaeum sp.]